jgi:hypothetical protein
MKVVKKGNADYYCFRCPGCGDIHSIPVHGEKNAWGFNDNVDKPTFTPSLLVRCGHYCSGQEGKECWCTYRKEHPENKNAPKCSLCHSFITDGKIQFLGDCTHDLKGQTIELPELDESFIEYYGK